MSPPGPIASPASSDPAALLTAANDPRALLRAYAAERPFTDDERRMWNAALRAAALRFWLSRLEDKHLPRGGELVQVKDPDEYRDILRRRIAAPHSLPDA